MHAGSGRLRVLVAGAGVAGLDLVLRLSELVRDEADVEVIAPERTFSHPPSAVGRAFGAAPQRSLDVRHLASGCGAQYRRGRIVAVDAGRRLAFTASGRQIPYDLLVVACGARPAAALAAHVTFRGAQDEPALRDLLREVDRGDVEHVAFVVPPGASWPLPLYELALLTAARLARLPRRDCTVSLVTPEATPLALFGARASASVAALLEAARVDTYCGCYPDRIVAGRLRLVPRGSLAIERVVALPRLHGPGLVGLPSDPVGFIPVDRQGRVVGVDDVYAVGDVTAFPVKHGGIATLQAEAAAASIAARLGAGVAPGRFRPLLRGLLLTGAEPRFLWADLGGGRGETSMSASYPLWWPPDKIAGGTIARYFRDEGPFVPTSRAGGDAAEDAIRRRASRPAPHPAA